MKKQKKKTKFQITLYAHYLKVVFYVYTAAPVVVRKTVCVCTHHARFSRVPWYACIKHNIVLYSRGRRVVVYESGNVSCVSIVVVKPVSTVKQSRRASES